MLNFLTATASRSARLYLPETVIESIADASSAA
jgi:hypothetical protein